MTVYLVTGQYETQYKTTIDIFRKEDKAKKFVEEQVNKLLNDPRGFEVGYRSKDDRLIQIVWKEEDRVYEYDFDVYAVFVIKEEQVK